MVISFDSWVREFVDDQDLNGYARERAVEALQADPTLSELWSASHAADDRQGDLRTWDDEEPTETIRALQSARRSCDEAVDTLAERVVREAVTDVEVHSHTVDLRHARSLDCPSCGESVEAFYLGMDDEGGVGWVCGHCGATVVEDIERGDIKRCEVSTEGGA